MPTPTAKHLPHRAREIRGLMHGQFSAWSIYPDQLPAMRRALTRTILVHSAPCGDLHFVKVWSRQLADGCLSTLGLVPPADYKPATKTRRKS